AATDVIVSGVPLHRATGDGLPGDSPDAQKIWATPGANIQISPLTATNPAGTNHTLTGSGNVDPTGGGGVANAPDGTGSNVTKAGGRGSLVGGASCTTAGGTGSCTAVITSATPGTTVVRAATTVTISGIVLHRETSDGFPGDSVDAQKLWTAAPPNCKNVVV